MASERFARVDALLGVALRLARTTPSGRILLARLASTIDLEWIPLPWGQELVTALTDTHRNVGEPLEPKRVEQILARAWPGGAADELDELDFDPVAVTATAQVHRGVRDGAPVAVKVLRPGLSAGVRQDLSVLEGLLAPLGAAFPAVDAGAVLREFRERVLDELDLENEAQIQRRFHRGLRGHPLLHVPAPVTELAHESVLVSEWIDGKPLWDAPDPDEAAASLVLFGIGAAASGLVHADLKPDDVLVMADGRLAVIDFGAGAAIDRERTRLMRDAVEAFAEDDEQAFTRALEALGSLAPEHAGTALAFARHALGTLAGEAPSRLDVEAVIAARDRALERPDALSELIAAGTLPPADLWPARGTAQLFSTIARIGATGAWRELVRAALQEGWGP